MMLKITPSFVFSFCFGLILVNVVRWLVPGLNHYSLSDYYAYSGGLMLLFGLLITQGNRLSQEEQDRRNSRQATAELVSIGGVLLLKSYLLALLVSPV